MADFSTLIASIEATIKENGVQAITGQVLQDELLLMVSAMNQLKQDTLEGYAFYGEPLPNGATRVVTQNTFFLAGAGSYTINGNSVTIADNGISVIVYDCVNDEITTYQLFAYDANPTSGSANAVTSGGVKSALDTKADKDGHYPDLFAGFAGNLVDTRSAGTRQSFAFRQSGGDGVNYMRKILGRTEAFNQLVDNPNVEITLLNGHTYLLHDSTPQVWRVITRTSDTQYNPSSNNCDQIFDLTLEGLGITTAEQFRALHPLPYYNYNAGVLKNNAATGLETTGFNQWDEEWEVGALNTSNGSNSSSSTNIRTKNYIPVFPSTTYYFRTGWTASGGYLVVCYYDADKKFLSYAVVPKNNTFSTPAGAGFMRFYVEATYGTTYNHDICINLSDASRNGTYEPYWKREIVLGLGNLACHDENNNAVVVNGLDGVGTSQDELIVENGWGTKIIKRRGRRAYQAGDESDATLMTDGTNTDYPLATPKVLTLDNPIPALIEVDNLGTEKRLPEDTADNPQAPFECDSNYSISTANLVRKLNE